jgi:hypothetical protein
VKPPYLITAPTQDVVTLEEAKAQLRIDDDAQDDLIQAILDATVAQIDPSSGGWLDRALRPQTWEIRRPTFYSATDQGNPRAEWGVYPFNAATISLPFPPLMSVVSVKYDDGAGVEHTLVEGTGFRVLGRDTVQGKASIAPLINQYWPVTRVDFESVRIRYTCGYDKSVSGDLLPRPIKQAIHLAVRQLYSLGERNLFQSLKTVVGVSETRWVVSPMASQIIDEAVTSLLSTYRVW